MGSSGGCLGEGGDGDLFVDLSINYFLKEGWQHNLTKFSGLTVKHLISLYKTCIFPALAMDKSGPFSHLSIYLKTLLVCLFVRLFVFNKRQNG